MNIDPKEKEKSIEIVSEKINPYLYHSEPSIRKYAIRILSRTSKRNIRYLQQLEESRLDVNIEIIRAIRMLNAL